MYLDDAVSIHFIRRLPSRDYFAQQESACSHALDTQSPAVWHRIDEVRWMLAVGVLSRAMAGLDNAAHLALEATEVALIIFG